MSLKNGGDLIVRLKSVTLRSTAGLIFAVGTFFKDVGIVRPASVPHWTRDMYVVFYHMRPAEELLNYLGSMWRDACRRQMPLLQTVPPKYFTNVGFASWLTQWASHAAESTITDLKSRTIEATGGNGGSQNRQDKARQMYWPDTSSQQMRNSQIRSFLTVFGLRGTMCFGEDSEEKVDELEEEEDWSDVLFEDDDDVDDTESEDEGDDDAAADDDDDDDDVMDLVEAREMQFLDTLG